VKVNPHIVKNRRVKRAEERGHGEGPGATCRRPADWRVGISRGRDRRRRLRRTCGGSPAEAPARVLPSTATTTTSSSPALPGRYCGPLARGDRCAHPADPRPEEHDRPPGRCRITQSAGAWCSPTRRSPTITWWWRPGPPTPTSATGVGSFRARAQDPRRRPESATAPFSPSMGRARQTMKARRWLTFVSGRTHRCGDGGAFAGSRNTLRRDFRRIDPRTARWFSWGGAT
jgi:hypothetical protein